MFTGLVEEKGRVERIESGPGGIRLKVSAPKIATEVKLGDSVAVNGVCLTAVEIKPPSLAFDVVKETVSRSNIGRLKSGDSVNLERSLRLGDRLGGHLVQGHVDGIGTIREIRAVGGETVFKFNASPEAMAFIVEKGSIAIDGISLTVADAGEDWFAVAIIPHTLGETTLGEAKMGGIVNLETDIIGKYVYKFVGKLGGTSDRELLDKLSEAGFME